jgi:hypothetical protein
MAGRTKCHQVFQNVVAELAPLDLVMYLQVLQRTAILTPQSISFEHSVAEQRVLFNAEPKSGFLLAKLPHFP